MGCIVSINLSSRLGTYTVEFGDGSDAEIKEAALSAAKRQCVLTQLVTVQRLG